MGVKIIATWNLDYPIYSCFLWNLKIYMEFGLSNLFLFLVGYKIAIFDEKV